MKIQRIQPRNGPAGRPKVNGEQVNKKIETAIAVIEKLQKVLFMICFYGCGRGGGCSSNEKEQKK